MTLNTFDPSDLANGRNETRWPAARQNAVATVNFDEDDPQAIQCGIIGSSETIESSWSRLRLSPPTDSTVLIQGETGTGKELFAQAIHTLRRRRGVFTGAVSQRIGRFEMANGGTLFLDEIGDIALELQAKLLRVLQEQTFERLGSTRTSRVNVPEPDKSGSQARAPALQCNWCPNGEFCKYLIFSPLANLSLELPSAQYAENNSIA